jgi:hypothetical protein
MDAKGFTNDGDEGCRQKSVASPIKARQLSSIRCKQEVNIQTELKKIWCGCFYWILLDSDGICLIIIVNL